jgi:hypothetical protein
MRRTRRGSGSDVIIDLTSLLDVIFIILLIVMWGQSMVETNLLQTQAEAEAAISQTEAEQQLYRQQQEIADGINQIVFAVSVIVPYDKEDVTHREIKMLKEGKEIESFQLVGNNVTEAVEDFRKSLVSYIEQNSTRPVILALNENDDNILYRDEVMVTELFFELTKEYSNVYIRGSVSEEEK